MDKISNMSKCYSLTLSQGSRTIKTCQFILTAPITIKSYDINLMQFEPNMYAEDLKETQNNPQKSKSKHQNGKTLIKQRENPLKSATIKSKWDKCLFNT